jgi:hypothetical protein
LYSSSIIISMIISRKIKWMCLYQVWGDDKWIQVLSGKPERKYLRVGGSIILELIFGNRVWFGFIWLIIWTCGGFL